MSRKKRKPERESAEHRPRSEPMLGIQPAELTLALVLMPQAGQAPTSHQRSSSPPEVSTAPLPAGWEWSTIGEVAHIQLGRQRSPQHHQGKQMRQYLRAANVTKRGLSLADVKEMNFDDTDFEKYRLDVGDLLLNEAWNPGGASLPVIWNGELEDCCFQNTLFRLRPVGVLLHYLYWYCYCAAYTGQFAEASRGVTIRHLGKRGLSGFPIPVPPVEEQRRIVEMVEELFSRLDAAEGRVADARAKLDQLERSILHEALTPPRGTASDLLTEREAAADPAAVALAESGHAGGWRSTTLGEVVSLQRRRVDPSQLGEECNLVHWSIPAFDRCGGPLEEPAGSIRSHKFRLADDCVLVSLLNPQIPRVAICAGGERVVCSTEFAVLVPGSAITLEFLAYATSEPGFHQRLVNLTSGTTNSRKRAKPVELLSLAILVPSLDEQRRIVEMVEERLARLEPLKQAVDSASEQAGSLRRSILTAALSGRLTSQERAA